MPAAPPIKRPAAFEDDRIPSKRPKREDPDSSNERGLESAPDGPRNGIMKGNNSKRDRSRSPSRREKTEDGRQNRYRQRDDGRDRRDNSRRSPQRHGENSRDRPRREDDQGRGRDRDREDRSEPPKVPKSAVPTGPAKQRTPNGPAAGTGPTSQATMAKTNLDANEAAKENPLEGLDDDDAEIMKMMGFYKWKSTKNTKVPGNDRNYAVRREQQTKYRQYMNRPGGFNRPLSPSRK